jgi:hypothetical protein
MMMGGMGFGMGLFGLIPMLIFWTGLLALAIWLVSLLFPAPKNSQDHPNSSKR